MKEKLVALDSQRSKDKSGHLHVARTILSEAAVNEYFGYEIPEYKELGIDPDKIYRMLRDPEELEKAAHTFKGKPLLIKHEYTDAENHKKDLTIGSIGSDVEYENGKVYGDMTVWDEKAIELIESEKMNELSASYWYSAIMRSGTYKGKPYDGIMTKMDGNHVALVVRGRIGNDAVISDSLPFDLEFHMKLKKGTKERIAEKIRAIAKDSIACDEAAEEVIRYVVDSVETKEEKPTFDMDEIKAIVGDNDKYAKLAEILGAKAADDEVPNAPEGGAPKPAEDEDEGEKAKEERKELEETDRDDRDAKNDDKKEAAMDADSIAAAVQTKIEAKYLARDKVESIVGKIALDGFADASAIYAFALKQKGVACDGINEAGLAALVGMVASKKTIAQDSAPSTVSDLTKRFKQA